MANLRQPAMIPLVCVVSAAAIFSLHNEVYASGSYIVNVDGKQYLFGVIAGGAHGPIGIEDVSVDKDRKALVVTLAPHQENGTLGIQLLRELIDSKDNNQTDASFNVLVDGEQGEFTEITGSGSGVPGRHLTIEIEKDSREIVIIGTYMVPELGSLSMIILAAAISSIAVLAYARRNRFGTIG